MVLVKVVLKLILNIEDRLKFEIDLLLALESLLKNQLKLIHLRPWGNGWKDISDIA